MIRVAFVLVLAACSPSQPVVDAGGTDGSSDVNCGGLECVPGPGQPAVCPPCEPASSDASCNSVGTQCNYSDGCYYASVCTCNPPDAGDGGATWKCLGSL